MTKHYDKLVRNRIPEIISRTGGTCETKILSEEDYLFYLDAKLSEELEEYRQSKSPEELADLLEAIYAAAAARGCSREELERIREEKKEKRGGFEDRILLLSVDEP
ncbi:MAG: phosphoribosyl-ATP pyrophosphohydrolase [Faecousia sp.]